MKMVKSLLLGGAAGLVALTGAQAADLPVKAAPVQYVKVCSLYGAGFYYMPGTDTCLKVGGYMRAEVNYQAGGSHGVPATLLLNNRNAFLQDWRTRAAITLDARSQTAFGTLRSYLFISSTDDNSGRNSANPAPGNISGASGYTRIYAPVGFIQLAGFTVGKTDSFFDFDSNPYTNTSPYWSTGQGGNGVQLFAYTAQFGNGWSATLSLQDAESSRTGIANGAVTVAAASGAGAYGATQPYANQQWPDIVGNIRVDQAWGSAQIAGLIHQVRAQDTTVIAGPANHPGDETGYAIGGGLKLNLPMLGKGDYVMGAVNYSKGVVDVNAANENSPVQVVGSGYPLTAATVGPIADAVIVPGNTLDLASNFSFTAGYEHFWNSQWKTSLWGEYGKISYSAAASAVLLPAGATVGSSANWSLYTIGSRTVWTVVPNLDLSVEVLYNNMTTAFSGPALKNQDWVSGIFRVQRNFYP